MGHKRVLLVEGSDDLHVVMNFCGALELGLIDNIRDCQGKEKLLGLIPTQLKESDLFALGILLDADSDMSATWQSVRDLLKESGYLLPDSPDSAGTIVAACSDLSPRVGVWLMPNNENPGIIEDFLRVLVPDADPLMDHVEKSIDSIPNNCCKFVELKRSKARIHTWLAWQEEPGKPLGQSIKARYLDPTLPAASDFESWLQRTFFDE